MEEFQDQEQEFPGILEKNDFFREIIEMIKMKRRDEMNKGCF